MAWINADNRATRRVWRTVEGDFVPEGDQRAAFLAYGEGDLVSPVDRDGLRATESAGPTKNMPAPADKSVKPSGNKGA
jgi:hypothetical protein